MAVFAVYIVKELSFQGQVRQFGNTYHYRTSIDSPFDDQATAERVAGAEREITSASVKFVEWRTWGPTDGSDFDNVMREVGTLDYNGNGATASGLFAECAVLVSWEISRSEVLNRRRWLRKYIRMPQVGPAMMEATMEGRAPIDESVMSYYMEYGNTVKSTGGPTQDAFPLCTEDGDGVPLATNPIVKPYLVTRQIGS